MTPSNKLYVWNLPPEVDSATLRALFEAVGTVEGLQMRPERMVEAALIVMSDIQQAENAKQRYDGYVLHGRVIRVGYELPAEGKAQILYVHNLPPNIQVVHLHKLFDPMGDVHRVELVQGRDGTFLGSAIVEMSDHEGVRMARHHLDRLNVVGYTIRVEPLRGSEGYRGLPLPPDQERAMHDLADELGEFRPSPVDQIRDIVRYMGLDYAYDLHKQVQEIEAQGGMMTKDGSRRRTPGGVFFTLARETLPPLLVPVIFSDRN
ncbi:MAG: hypothetical protein ACLFTK_11115 [Anaerolineales bacterium]